MLLAIPSPGGGYRSGGTEGTKRISKGVTANAPAGPRPGRLWRLAAGKSGGESARGSQSGLGRDRKVELDARCRRMQRRGPSALWSGMESWGRRTGEQAAAGGPAVADAGRTAVADGTGGDGAQWTQQRRAVGRAAISGLAWMHNVNDLGVLILGRGNPRWWRWFKGRGRGSWWG